MILKKPYAFLIKYFKIIHLICLILITIITYNFQKVVTFFTNYNNTTTIGEKAGSTYISFIFLVLCLIVVAFFIMMYFLMRKKDKPNKFYLLGSIYYVIIFLSLIYGINTINSLYTITMDIKVFRALHDIYLILYLPNFLIAIMSFIRGFGFDIKKFNFNKDLAELEIKSEDNEEFEFVLGTDNYVIKRKIRRYFRELKYYFIENKVLVSIILGVAAVILLISLFINRTIVNKIYHVGDTITTSEFTIKLNKAYITAKDYKGNIIKEDKKYVILNATISSNKTPSKSLAPEYIYMSLGKYRISNIKTTLADSFKDLGASYQNFKITDKEANYIFVFEVDKTKYSRSYDLNFFDGISYDKDNNLIYNYKVANIKPQNIDLELKSEDKNLNDTFYIGSKLYGNTELSIIKTSISDKYEFTYDKCDGETCMPLTDIEFPDNSLSNSLLALNYNIIIDKNSGLNDSNMASILTKLIKLKYKQNDNYKEEAIISKNNSNLKNVLLIDIPKYIVSSNEIYIVISSRENSYQIKIK